jgi:hypothetical protein
MLIAPIFGALSSFQEVVMDNGTARNERDRSESWVEGLLTNAGASVGRLLDDRQVHAVSLALEVFAYLLAALPADQVEVRDVIKLLKYFSRGVNNAKSQS